MKEVFGNVPGIWLYVFASVVLLCGCGEYGVYVDDVTRHELSGILSLGGFPEDLECKVEHSYSSSWPPPNNDHFKAYAIHLASFPESLLATNQNGRSLWDRGPVTNEMQLKTLRAAQLASTVTTNVSWLPRLEEFSTTNYYRYFVYINVRDGEPNPAQFFGYNRQKQILYFISYKH